MFIIPEKFIIHSSRVFFHSCIKLSTETTSTTTQEFWTTTESPPTTTEAPDHDPSTTTFALTQTGAKTIVSTGTCPPQEVTTIVVDGEAYTRGPGTIVLYECSEIDATYDLMNFHLVNFPEGLWFELSYKSDSINLVIKSLANYKDYSESYRDTYPYEEYPEQVHTDHFPDFSWDTVPTWTRLSKNLHFIKNMNSPNRGSWNTNMGPWSDEDLDLISKQHFLSWYGLNTPEHVTQTYDRIKGFDPTHKTLFYWNAETWWGAGSEGSGLQQDYLREGVFGTNDRKLYDHSNPNMRNWWKNYGLDRANHPSSDGVFTDNTISRECDNGTCDLEATDKSIMVKELAQSVPDEKLDIGNYLRNMIDGGNRFRMRDADGSYFENIHFAPGVDDKLEPIIVSMQLAREASWKKKVVMWTGSRRNCRCVLNKSHLYKHACTTVGQTGCIPQSCVGFVQTNGVEPTALLQNDFEIALAEFLMVVEKWSYGYFAVSPDWTCERWRADWSHMELFNKPLGRPLGPPLKSGHTFSRHFEHLSVKIGLKFTGYEESAAGVGGNVEFIFH